MATYKNLSGVSGVLQYEILENAIIVTFREGSHRRYHYSYQSTGQNRVETMKQLAIRGLGLNRYIKEHVGKAYESRQ